MKKTVLASAAVALIGVAVMAGPALAQNRTNITNINTLNSAFFGFVPTAGNIDTFMQKDATSSSVNGTFNAYIKNNQMPGAYTQRPDKVVNAISDYGCGPSLAVCDESVRNIEDRVNGNTTTANLAGNPPGTGVLGNGQNTAPTNVNGVVGAGNVTGVMVGDLNHTVYLESAEDGMPSGSIVFHRTDGINTAPGATTGVPIMVDFDQNINFSIAGGFQTFSEHDFTTSPIAALLCEAALPCAEGAVQPANASYGARHSGVDGGAAHSNMGIRAVLSLSQASLGGEGTGTEAVGYTVDWQGNGTYPTPGAYFTPGLNAGDWQGDPNPDTNGFPN
jgi:hypothetical protein